MGRVEHFVGAAGFCARLLVELVARDGGLSVDLLAGPHDVAQGRVLGGDPPGCEGQCVHLLQIVLTGDVLLRQPQPGHRDERRELLGPLHGGVLHRHPPQVGAELNLDVEGVGPLLQLGHQGRPEDLRRRGRVDGAPDHRVGEVRVGGDAHLGDVVAVPDRAHRPVARQQHVDQGDLRQAQVGQELIPRPVVLVQRSLSGHELGDRSDARRVGPGRSRPARSGTVPG